jgi:hypothetical protein
VPQRRSRAKTSSTMLFANHEQAPAITTHIATAAPRSANGATRAALDLLRATQQHYLEQDSPLEAASAGLEMAVVLARLGRKQEVRRLAAAALREFGVRGIQHDYLAALILLRQAS